MFGDLPITRFETCWCSIATFPEGISSIYPTVGVTGLFHYDFWHLSLPSTVKGSAKTLLGSVLEVDALLSISSLRSSIIAMGNSLSMKALLGKYGKIIYIYKYIGRFHCHVWLPDGIRWVPKLHFLSYDSFMITLNNFFVVSAVISFCTLFRFCPLFAQHIQLTHD